MIERWTGLLKTVGSSDTAKDGELLGTFANAQELAIILEDQELFA